MQRYGAMEDTILERAREGRLPQQTWLKNTDLPLTHCMDMCHTNFPSNPEYRAKCLSKCIHEDTTEKKEAYGVDFTPLSSFMSKLKPKMRLPQHFNALALAGVALVGTGGLLHYYAKTEKKEMLERALGGKAHTSTLSSILLAFGGSTLAASIIVYIQSLYPNRFLPFE